MAMEVIFPGGKKVDADFKGFMIKTDQAERDGGEGSAPTPFAVFLASMGTCAGIYVLGFCQQRGLPTDGIRVVQRMHSNPFSGMIGKIDLEIQVPPTFPEKYMPALTRAAELCAVKKHFEQPPQFDVYTKTMEAVAA